VIESGKDIYGEKPLSRWIAQGVKLKKMVRQYGTIFQVGLQQRSDPKFRLACSLARNGYLGKVSEVQVAVPGGTVIPAVAPCDPPGGFDWDMWTGPAPMFPFDPRRVEWLGLYMISHYCAGFITNWGVHHLDIAGWGRAGNLRKTVRSLRPRRPARQRNGRHLDFLANADAVRKRPGDEFLQHGQPV